MYDHLSELAQRLGMHMARGCTDGLRGHFGDQLLDDFPNENRKSLGMALAELDADGFVTLSHVLGPHLPRARTTWELFIACDPAITGHDPVEDSVALAGLLLEKPDLGGNASRLENAVGWPLRRFNPAFALLIPLIADGRTRKPIQNRYPVLGFVLAAEDLVAIQRYVRDSS